PPDRMTPTACRARIRSAGVSGGQISEYTDSSRNRRAMSWVYCEPKSRTMMVWWFRGSLSGTKGKRYYNGVRRPGTTTSCSAVALIVLLGFAISADAPASDRRLFPVRGAWTLALESALSAPPGFSETRGF